MSDDLEKAIEAAERLLPLLPPTPWRANAMTNPDQVPAIATVRDDNGYPVLAPHPEAMSMMTGSPAVFEFFVRSPALVRILLDQVKSTRNPVESTGKAVDSGESE